MSEVIVQVLPIENIRKHPDPETTELMVGDVGGWSCVFNKNNGYTEGQPVLFIPPDALIPNEKADEWGVANYLTEGKNHFGFLRTRSIRLRGEPSFGLTMSVPEGLEWEYGENLAETLGIRKYEPPIRGTVADAEKDDPLFIRYTDIESLRNYTKVLQNGEEVVATVKQNGSNVRLGKIAGEIMAGSHRLRRRCPINEEYQNNLYWFGYSLPSVQNFLDDVNANQVILFGEVYGPTVIKGFDYGLLSGNLGFVAFDIYINGKYLDYDQFRSVCKNYDIPMVPEVYRGPFSIDIIRELAESTARLGGKHVEEGLVVKPITERYDHNVGRVVLKWLSDNYLTLKNKVDYTDA